MTKPRKSDREIKAMAYTIADEILTRAQPYEAAGMTRIQAINKAMDEMTA